VRLKNSKPHVGADGVHRRVGDVQDAHDSVDERQAQGDQASIDPGCDAFKKLFEE